MGILFLPMQITGKHLVHLFSHIIHAKREHMVQHTYRNMFVYRWQIAYTENQKRLHLHIHEVVTGHLGHTSTYKRRYGIVAVRSFLIGNLFLDILLQDIRHRVLVHFLGRTGIYQQANNKQNTNCNNQLFHNIKSIIIISPITGMAEPSRRRTF